MKKPGYRAISFILAFIMIISLSGNAIAESGGLFASRAFAAEESETGAGQDVMQPETGTSGAAAFPEEAPVQENSTDLAEDSGSEIAETVPESGDSGQGEALPQETVPEETDPEETIPEDTAETGTEETAPEESAPEEPAPEETVPAEAAPEEAADEAQAEQQMDVKEEDTGAAQPEQEAEDTDENEPAAEPAAEAETAVPTPAPAPAPTAASADVPVMRTIPAQAFETTLYDEHGNTTEYIDRVNAFWNWLFERIPFTARDRYPDDYEPVSSEVTVQVTGLLHNGVTARAYFTTMAEEDIYSEKALMALDLELRDAQGNLYTPQGELTITVGGYVVGSAIAQDKALLIYDYRVNAERQNRLREYAADVLVYRDDLVDARRLRYYGEKGDEEAVLFAEDAEGLTEYEDYTLSFKTTAMPLNLVIAEQVRERTMHAQTQDGATDIELSGALSDNTSANIMVRNADEVSEETGGEGLFGVDISLSDSEAGEYSPDLPISVTITDAQIGEAIGRDSELEVWQIGGEDGPGKVEDARFYGNTAAFQAEGSMSYAVVETYLERTLETSDGEVYKVSVSYDRSSGIPANAELYVEQIPEGTQAYEDYVERSAQQLGMSREEMEFAKAFDIRLTDPRTGAVYQPNESVDVRIELLDTDVSREERVDVVHFGDGAEQVDCALEGDAVTFKANGFSVYVVIGKKVPRLTFRFYVWNDEIESYVGYGITTDSGETAYSQTIKKGEQPVVPRLTSDDSRAFAGWYEGYSDGSQIVLSETPYDFDNIPDFTADGQVDLYAQFRDYAYVVFHDQYSAETGSFPVSSTRRGILSGTPASAAVDISDCSATYSSSGEGTSAMAFYGWSYTPVTVPGSATDDEGRPVSTITEDAVTISGTTHLYPVFKSMHWLSYYTGAAGSGANYIPPARQFEGEGPAALEVPVRSGYTFAGWYTGTLSGDTVRYGMQITDGTGALIEGRDDGGVYVEDGVLLLRQDSMLYAMWEENASASYRIHIWKQRTTDEEGLPDSEKTYDYEESVVLTGATGSSVSVPEDCRTRSYEGFSYSRCDDPAVVRSDGSTALHVYYDLDAFPYQESGMEHTLRFLDSETGAPSPDLQDVSYQVSYREDLSSYIPGDPASGRQGYTFDGWFADRACTVPASPDTMPDENLTFYAGWKNIRYLIRIDPNYGSLNGTGACWFFEDYDGDPIQEYTQVTRDYVESSSGSWYYAKHDRDYYGLPDWQVPEESGKDRDARYTQDPDEASEFTTFEYAPGAYRYAGWYEVHEDGSETPYVFGQRVDHDTTLRLHWKKLGTYYIEYEPVAEVDGKTLTGVLDQGEKNEALYVELDGDSYADNSEVVVTRSVTPPEGYAFAGWRIRGDDSGRLYGPGQSFLLKSAFTQSVGGRETVCLDAVYVRVGTARIVYDANGGQVGEEVDYGAPVSELAPAVSKKHDGTTASIGGLVSNTNVSLSDGTGFSMEGAELLGWSSRQVYDPADPGADFFSLGGEYGVDTEEPVTLYAVWGVKVFYHLNKDTDEAQWGEAWQQEPYVQVDEKTFSETVYLGQPVAKPESAPVYTGEEGLVFRNWRTSAIGDGQAADDSSVYDFAQPVTGALDLYAYWDGPVKVPVHAVDTSAYTMEDRDGTWLAEGAFIPAGTGGTSLESEEDAAAYMKENMPPEGYVFAFAAVHGSAADLQTVSEEEAVTGVFYNPDEGRVYVRYADGEKEDAPLREGDEICLVYYQERALSVEYVCMDTSGALSEADAAPEAPRTTGEALLGTGDVRELLDSPLAWENTGSYGYYAYAVGTLGADSESDLSLITAPSDSDDAQARPTLEIRATWRGLEYTVSEGDTWISCGYDAGLYVVYFERRPVMITIGEETVGTRTLLESESFAYEAVITDYADGTAGESQTIYFTLQDGGERTLTAWYWTAGEGDEEVVHTQTVTVSQTGKDTFDTEIGADEGSSTASGVWTYTTGPGEAAPTVTFTNRHKAMPVEVHVAVAENGRIVRRDDLRADGSAIFALPLGGEAVFEEELDPAALFAGDLNTFAFGTVLLGSETGADGERIEVKGIGARSVSYAQVSPPDGRVYDAVLQDGEGGSLGAISGNAVYYMYYPMPEICYVKESLDGTLTPVRGSTDGSSVTGDITYNRAGVTMNGVTVTQNQRMEISMDGSVISQSAGSTAFRMPPILDDGTAERYLSYAKIGAGESGASAIGDLDGHVSEGQTMYLKVQDSALQWSFDGETWHPMALTETATIYAIYTERGYDLQIIKEVDTQQSGDDPVLTGREFTVTLSSRAISKSSYEAEGADRERVDATPAPGTAPGTITLQVHGGSKVKIIGLGRGESTVTEGNNENFTLTAKTGPITGTEETDAPVTDNARFTVTLDTEKKAKLTNTPDPICKITDGGTEKVFYTLRSAVSYVGENIPDLTAEIAMLADYRIPADDSVTIPGNYNITLSTATEGVYRYKGSGKAVITRGQDLLAAPMFVNDAALTFTNVILDGESVTADAPMIESTGTVTVGTGSILRNAVSTGDGGAIRAAAGDVYISSGTLSGNQAANGGAVYYTGSGEIRVLGNARISGNRASSGDGGAIYAASGTITLSGTAGISSNASPAGAGGAIAIGSAVLNVEQSASVTGNTAGSGGAVCAENGTITVSGDAAFSGNAAEVGDGGAILNRAGIVTVSGGTFTGNRASGGNGGALFTQSGTIAVSDGTMSQNAAADGAAVYIQNGTGRFSGGEVTENTASAGGAVGVGNSAAKLYFSGNISITGNTMGSQESNVCLSLDTDAVINAQDLGSSARIGIYVPGGFEEELFKNRGQAGARFGIYTAADNLSAFTNDRIPTLEARADTDARRIVWGSPLKVEVRSLPSFAGGFPPVQAGTLIYRNDAYYPAFSAGAMSKLADALYENYSGRLTATAAYAAAFADGAASYGDYITNMRWDSSEGSWVFVKRDGSSVQADKVILYYAEPAFITIENNTDLPLDVSSLTVGGHSVVNSDTEAGYGLVFAKNDTLQEALLPVESGDLSLAVGESIRLLIPGGCEQTYVLGGRFDTAQGHDVRLRRTGKQEETIPAQEVREGFTLTDQTIRTPGTNYEIIFGDDKYICKIADGGEEVRFSSISEAVQYAQDHSLTTVTIEMLTDYLIPEQDSVVIPENYDITLTTAVTGNYRYPGTDEDRRAVISRDSENRNSFFSGSYEPGETAFTIRNLDMDGKSIRGNSDGGAVKTRNIAVTIENAAFRNFISGNGGAIFVEFSRLTEYDYAAFSRLSADNVSFENCHSVSTANRQGGGAIWTNAYALSISDSTFESCSAYDQGGALFHRIDVDYMDAYRRGSGAEITGCSFTNCSARAAGGLEIDAYYAAITDCTFRNCRGTQRNGGGINVYIQSTDSSATAGSTEDTTLIVRGCSFEDCSSLTNGGGVRSMALHTEIANSTFSNLTAAETGGAVSITNRYAEDAAILGCTIENCSSSTTGGGIYCRALTMKTADYTEDGDTVHTVIRNCTAVGGGGGICYDRNAAATSCSLENVTIDSCSSSNDAGGGLYTNACTVNVTGSDVRNCSASGSGGGIAQNKNNTGTALTLENSSVTGNSAGNLGGGVYTRINLAMIDSEITGNRLTSSTAGNAAGAYISNNGTLIVGTAGGTDSSAVKENLTASGTPSNLRLWEGNGVNNAASVSVLCDLTGEIRVVNAANQGTQFGSAAIAYPGGVSETDPVFRSDDDTLYGIIQRTDPAGKKIIWGGPPVCKITDGDGNLLYFRTDGTDPAIFDMLDSRSGSNGDRTSAFSLLRGNNPELYYQDGTRYSGKVYGVRMLVETYELSTYVSTVRLDRTIILTTAGSGDTDGYPYRGRAGSRCTILRGASFPQNSNMLTMRVNGILRNITLDGGSQLGRTMTGDGNAIVMKDCYNDDVVVTLGENAVLPNCTATGGGGAVRVDKGSFRIEGGTIRNCQAANGGAVYINSGRALNLIEGSILQCRATANGGAVYLNNGIFNMAGGSIAQCTAVSGGGAYVANNRTMNMSGGFITGNTATSVGGGIAPGGSGARLFFSGKPTVSGNKLGNDACNVHLNYDTKAIIQSQGLYNGARIGVYVPDHDGLYEKRGVETKDFGTFTAGSDTTTLYGFVNDRNGLKGGLIENPQPNTIYWVKIFSIEVSKEVRASSHVPAAAEDTFRFRVKLSGKSNDGTVLASDIDGEYGEMNFTPSGRDSYAEFTLRSGESILAENLPAGLDYEVTEILTGAQQDRYAVLPALVRTGKVGENARPDVPETDWYVSKADYVNVRPICKILDPGGSLLYYRYDAQHNAPAVYTELADAFAALDGTLYAGESLYAPTYDVRKGCRIEMLVPDYSLPQALTLKEAYKAVLTTASEDAEQFPYQGPAGSTAVIRRAFDGGTMFTAQGDMTVNRITLDGAGDTYTCNSYGGIMNVPQSGRLTIESGAVLQNSHTLSRGGAVYNVGTLTMTGGSVKNNRCDGEGAGIFLTAGSVLRLSGNPDFGGKGTDAYGNIDTRSGNFRNGELIAQTNGGKTYTIARQDIYLAEDETDPACLVLTGDLTCPEGSIWVWAASEKHYVTMMPFAVLGGEPVGDASLRAFRDAQTDRLTLCGGDTYLTGSRGDDENFVYWTGGFDVLFTKTDGYGEPLPGATFGLYIDPACSQPLLYAGEPVTATSADGTSRYTDRTGEPLPKGTVRFEKIPAGTYFMKETVTPVLDPDGQAMRYVNDNIYIVPVGSAALGQYGEGILEDITEQDIAAQTQRYYDKYGIRDYALFMIDSTSDRAVTVPDIAAYGVLNEAAAQRKAILRKVGREYVSLEGAVFQIHRADMTLVKDGTQDSFTSGPAGIFRVGMLPYGYYFIHEITVPDGYAANGEDGWWFTVRVDENGTAIVSDRGSRPVLPE